MGSRFAIDMAARKSRIARAIAGVGMLLALSGLWLYFWVVSPFVF
jgi:hypothetical protein